MTELVSFDSPARRMGKSQALQQALAAFLKANPKASIVTVRGGETIVEKHVEDVRPKLIGRDEQ